MTLFSDFARVYRLLPAPLRRAALAVFVCVATQAVLEISCILAISFLAISITAPERLFAVKPVAALFQAVPWLSFLHEDPRRLALLAATGAVCAIAAKNGLNALVRFATSRLGERIALFAGETLFQEFLYSPYAQHLAGDSATLFQRLGWRGQLAGMVIQLMGVYAYMGITFALCVTLVYCTPILVLFVMLLMGSIAAFVYTVLKRAVDRAGKNSAERGKATTKVTMNATRGIRETLIYRQQAVFFERFREACREGVRDRAFLTLAPPIPSWVLETAGFAVILAILVVMINVRNASVAQITAVLTMVMLTAWRVLPLLNRSLGALVSLRASRHQAMECLGALEEALANPAPPPSDPDPGFRFRGGIDLVHVAFAYPGAEQNSLRDVTFSIPFGCKVGIVGRSGAGKSTLAAILSGLMEPTEGAMRVDGRVLNGPELAAYRQLVGYVPQNPYIMGGSIAENVAFSRWGHPWDEEKVLRVCTMAECDVALRRGINATLGQDGAGLSGGQTQRLAIARALYADPSILILDEATSALDDGLEKAIMDTLFALPAAITTIIIAHRLSTVERCERVVWIEEGGVKMAGTPGDTLRQYRLFLDNAP